MGKIIRFDLMATEKEVRKLNEDLEALQRMIAAAEKELNETEAALNAELACPHEGPERDNSTVSSMTRMR